MVGETHVIWIVHNSDLFDVQIQGVIKAEDAQREEASSYI